VAFFVLNVMNGLHACSRRLVVSLGQVIRSRGLDLGVCEGKNFGRWKEGWARRILSV
jgi:hypothetical protein